MYTNLADDAKAQLNFMTPADLVQPGALLKINTILENVYEETVIEQFERLQKEWDTIARKPGQSMQNWYSAIKKARAEYQAVDTNSTISDQWLATKFLNRSGLGRKEKADVLLHVNNNLASEPMSKYMELKYGKHHLEDTRTGLKPVRSPKPYLNRPKRRFTRRYANVAEQDEEDYDVASSQEYTDGEEQVEEEDDEEGEEDPDDGEEDDQDVYYASDDEENEDERSTDMEDFAEPEDLDIPDFQGDQDLITAMQDVFVAGWANAKRKTAELRKARGFKKVGKPRAPTDRSKDRDKQNWEGRLKR
jgi:hypothetical protein